MLGWAVSGSPGDQGRLVSVEREAPVPGPFEVLVRVEVCGVCRTDLHLADGDLAPRAELRIPGHEVVGSVVEVGPQATRFGSGDRIGIAWLRQTCGVCAGCRQGRENLCRSATFTGWDADGGYAQYAVVHEGYAYTLPQEISAASLAPLLCSGIIGYRALKRAQLPPGGRLGIYGFGASAHLTAQLALAQGYEVHVLTEGRRHVSSPSSWAPPPRVVRPILRRSPWTLRCCSRRPANWSRWLWRRSNREARSHWQASISPTSPPWTTSTTCSASAR